MIDEDKVPEQVHFADELVRSAKAEPFTPFEIVVTSADRYLISEPFQLALGGDTVVRVLPKTGIRFFGKNQVVAVHVFEPAR